MPFKVEVRVYGEGDRWCGNSLVFQTQAEAEVYGADLSMRWTSVTDHQVVETAEKANSTVRFQPFKVVPLIHV